MNLFLFLILFFDFDLLFHVYYCSSSLVLVLLFLCLETVLLLVVFVCFSCLFLIIHIVFCDKVLCLEPVFLLMMLLFIPVVGSLSVVLVFFVIVYCFCLAEWDVGRMAAGVRSVVVVVRRAGTKEGKA